MTTEELLKPRYKVIADYPGNIMPVGSIFWDDIESIEIITPTGSRSVQGSYPYRDKHKFPHLFKPLQWWEDRKPEEMPEYVKWDYNAKTDDERVKGLVEKVIKWVQDGYGVIVSESMTIATCHWLPATEADYNTWKKENP